MAQEPTTGLFQWFKIGTSAANAGLGLITGGDLSSNPGTKRILGSGGKSVRKGGLLNFAAVTTFAVGGDNQAVIAAGLRNAYPRGTLTEYILAGGADDWGRQYTDAVVTQGSIAYSQDNPLSCTLNWGALGISEVVGSTMPDIAEDIFMDWDVSVDVEGGDYSCSAFTLNWNNNVAFKKAGKAKVSGQKRWPDYYLVGIEDASLDITLAKPLPTTVDAPFYDCLADDITVTISATSCNGDALVITVDNLMLQGDNNMALVDGNTQVEWPYSFMGSDMLGSIGWAFTASA